MKQQKKTARLVGLILWTTVLLPTSVQADTASSAGIAHPASVTMTTQLSSDKEKRLPGQFSGNASWYGAAFNGRKTASGEIFNMNKLTAAHLRLSLLTKVLVENPRNGKAIVVKVNDRGPYVKNRILDLRAEKIEDRFLSNQARMITHSN